MPNLFVRWRRSSESVKYQLSTLLGKLGRLHEAIECFEKVLESNPDDQEALECRAYALKSLSRKR